MLTNVRTRCGGDELAAQRPSPTTLLLLLSTQIQNYITEANLSSKPWAVDEMTLQAVSGTEDYPLPVDSNFGKPIQVRTMYSADPGHIERDVEFTELGEVNFDWGFPRNFGSSLMLDNSPNNMARIAFYRRAGVNQVYARVMPIPARSATYQILYQIGVYGEATPLDEIPLLPEHHALIELRTALASLPHCQWGDDEDFNRRRREELAASFQPDLARLTTNFKLYLASLSANYQPNYRAFPYSID